MGLEGTLPDQGSALEFEVKSKVWGRGEVSQSSLEVSKRHALCLELSYITGRDAEMLNLHFRAMALKKC